jgi:hypothetical protein
MKVVVACRLISKAFLLKIESAARLWNVEQCTVTSVFIVFMSNLFFTRIIKKVQGQLLNISSEKKDLILLAVTPHEDTTTPPHTPNHIELSQQRRREKRGFEKRGGH